MVDVNDPTGIGRKLQRQWDLLLGDEESGTDPADIDARDREAIIAFIQWRRDIGDVSRNTQKLDLSTLRRGAEWAPAPLVEFGLEDVESFFTQLTQPKAQGGRGYTPNGSSMYAFARVFRLFYRFMHDRESYAAYPFWEAIETPSIETEQELTREDMLTGADLEAMKDAARHPRDRALISFLGDVAGRIGLVLSLRVKDVHLDGDEPWFSPNTQVEDGLKDLDLTRIPILHSRAEIRTYLRHHHPDPDTPEAPLWALIRGYDPENPQDCAASVGRIRGVLRACRDRAGIDKPIDPHNFRRTTATRLSNSDRLTPQEIQALTGWKDSVLFEMMDRYDFTTDAERVSSIQTAMGFSDESTAAAPDELAVASAPCGTCRESFSTDARFCPNCGAPRDEDARAAQRELDTQAADRSLEAESRAEATDYEMVRRFVRDHPERAVEALEAGLKDATHD